MENDEKVRHLLNELVKEIQASGKPLIPEGKELGCLTIWINSANPPFEYEMLEIQDILTKYSVRVIPDFNIGVVQKNERTGINGHRAEGACYKDKLRRNKSKPQGNSVGV